MLEHACVTSLSDPVQGEGAMDGHHSLHLPGLLSGRWSLSQLCLLVPFIEKAHCCLLPVIV